MVEGRKLPALFGSRPVQVRVVPRVLLPADIGGIAGAVLSSLPALYVGLQVLGAVGGLLAGLEHRKAGEAALRGLCGGFFFGIGIIGLHAISGGTDHHLLGQLPIVLPAITAVSGAL